MVRAATNTRMPKYQSDLLAQNGPFFKFQLISTPVKVAANMEASFKSLYTIYIIISVFNGILMAVFYHYHKQNKRFAFALMIWIGNLGTIGIDALAIKTTPKFALLSFWPDYITVFFAVLLIEDLFLIETRKKQIAFFYLITYLISWGIYFYHPDSFFWSTLPMAGTVGLSLIYTGIRTLSKINRNIVYDFFLWISMIWGLHFLDYPILRPDPHMSLFGFSFSFILILILSVMLPFIINMKLKEESEDILSAHIEEKKHELQATVNDLITAQTKILEQEKFISLATLTSGIAHEIRNPLNIILNSAKILESDFKYENKNTDLLDLIIKNTERANTIIKNMLLKTSQLTHEKDFSEQTNLKQLIEDNLQKLKFEQHSHLEGEIHYQLNIPKNYQIRGKRTDLDSIVLNLIINAHYSLKEKYGKGLAKEPLTLKINAFTENSELKIEFIDNGMGVDKNNLNKIFDPFFTTKPSGIGTGLGLSIIRIMIEGLGGTIAVDTKHLEYCQFTLTFPEA